MPILKGIKKEADRFVVTALAVEHVLVVSTGGRMAQPTVALG